MKHLNEEELIDAAEGTRAESTWPHLASCVACRRQVTELRAMLSEAAGVGIPEPSPLFWDHLSARVREGLAAAGEERRAPSIETSVWWSWRVAVPALALAAVVIAAVVTVRGPWPQARMSPGDGSPGVVEARVPGHLAPLADDPSLSLIADLAGDVDWDAAVESGLATGAGGAERVLFDMSVDERLELQRLLEQELSGRSAS